MATPTRSLAGLVDNTPATRNRYLDFLRVFALTIVVYGHFLMALVVVGDGSLTIENALRQGEWIQWLTWVLQVMPLFFIVGGFVNAASWSSARERGDGYGTWVAARTRRLVGPAVAFVAVWTLAVLMISTTGMDPAQLTLGGQVVAVPVWFLSVYVIVIAMTPLTYSLHERFGAAALIGLVATAILADAASSAVPVVAWLNYLFLWGAVHQLGYLWRDGRFTQRMGPGLALGSLGALLVMVLWGPYAVAMVGVEGANNQPPNLALFVLGIMQLGVALTLEPLVQRVLKRRWAWKAVVVANGLAMTVYLWHMTALVALVGLGLMVDIPLLSLEPLSTAWWVSRPLWFLALTALVLPLVALFRRFDRIDRPNIGISAPAALVGAASASIAFGSLAAAGFHPGGDLNVVAVAAFFIAAVAVQRGSVAA